MILATLLVALAGCVPVTSLPPPLPMAQNETLEVGCSPIGQIHPSRGWAVQCHTVLSLENIEPDTASSVVGDPILDWKPKHSELGILLHRTSEGKYGFGMTQRIWFVEQGSFLVGFQGDLGTTWVHASVPLLFHATDWISVYSRPAWHVPLGFVAPFGVGIQMGELILGVEARFGKYKDLANEGAAKAVSQQSYGLSLSWRPQGLEPIEVR